METLAVNWGVRAAEAGPNTELEAVLVASAGFCTSIPKPKASEFGSMGELWSLGGQVQEAAPAELSGPGATGTPQVPPSLRL